MTICRAKARAQRGMSSLNLMIVLLVAGFFMMCAFKLVPSYAENMYVVDALKALGDGAKPVAEMSKSEKLLAEERFASNSPLKGNEKLKRAAKSITGRTTIATGDDQDYASMPKPKGRRIGNSR